MRKSLWHLSVLFVSLFLLSCSKELIKHEEFKITTDVSSNSTGKNSGFKTLDSYTKENYEIIKENTEREIEKEYEILKTTDSFTIDK